MASTLRRMWNDSAYNRLRIMLWWIFVYGAALAGLRLFDFHTQQTTTEPKLGAAQTSAPARGDDAPRLAEKRSIWAGRMPAANLGAAVGAMFAAARRPRGVTLTNEAHWPDFEASITFTPDIERQSPGGAYCFTCPDQQCLFKQVADGMRAVASALNGEGLRSLISATGTSDDGPLLGVFLGASADASRPQGGGKVLTCTNGVQKVSVREGYAKYGGECGEARCVSGITGHAVDLVKGTIIDANEKLACARALCLYDASGLRALPDVPVRLIGREGLTSDSSQRTVFGGIVLRKIMLEAAYFEDFNSSFRAALERHN